MQDRYMPLASAIASVIGEIVNLAKADNAAPAGARGEVQPAPAEDTKPKATRAAKEKTAEEKSEAAVLSVKEEAPASTHTATSVKTAALAASQKHSADAVRAILKDFGHAKSADLTPDQYDEFMDRLTQLDDAEV